MPSKTENMKAYQSFYYFVNRKEIIERSLERYHTQFAVNGGNARYRWKVKVEVLSHYSGGDRPRCAKCREEDTLVLCIDHVSGNGAEQRTRGGRRLGGYHLYMWLKRNNYPEGYQVLCMNCNTRKKYLDYNLYKGES